MWPNPLRVGYLQQVLTAGYALNKTSIDAIAQALAIAYGKVRTAHACSPAARPAGAALAACAPLPDCATLLSSSLLIGFWVSLTFVPAGTD